MNAPWPSEGIPPSPTDDPEAHRSSREIEVARQAIEPEAERSDGQKRGEEHHPGDRRRARAPRRARVPGRVHDGAPRLPQHRDPGHHVSRSAAPRSVASARTAT